MNYLLKNISDDYRVPAVCLFIALAGVSSGVFFKELLPDGDELFLAEILERTLLSECHPLLPAVLVNTVIMAVIFLAGISVYGFPAASVVLFLRSFSTGLCTSIVLSCAGRLSLKTLIAGYLVPNILLLSVFLIAVYICTRYGLALLYRSHDRTELQPSYFISFGILTIMTVFISACGSLFT